MKTFRLYLIRWVFAVIPSSRLFNLKSSLLRWCGAEVGRNVRVVSTARFYLTGKLILRDNAYIGDYSSILGGDAKVIIGKNSTIGPNCVLVTGSHELYSEKDIAAGEGYSSPIEVGDGTWIGSSSTVLGGVTIGKAAIVAAGSVLTKNVSDYGKVGGVPAKPINAEELN